jgi:hypothetical protein
VDLQSPAKRDIHARNEREGDDENRDDRHKAAREGPDGSETGSDCEKVRGSFIDDSTAQEVSVWSKRLAK